VFIETKPDGDLQCACLLLTAYKGSHGTLHAGTAACAHITSRLKQLVNDQLSVVNVALGPIKTTVLLFVIREHHQIDHDVSGNQSVDHLYFDLS
jgi:hypothetical protein